MSKKAEDVAAEPVSGGRPYLVLGTLVLMMVLSYLLTSSYT